MQVMLEFDKKTLSFTEPVKIICCYSPKQLANCFTEIEKVLAKGFYVAGFVSYEAGYALEPKLFEQKTYVFPLLCFGVYPKINYQRLWKRKKYNDKTPQIQNLKLNITKKDYSHNIQKIKDYIAQGEVYQITYCIKYHFESAKNKQELYDRLYQEQPVPYAAYLEKEDLFILSLSPERFIKKCGTYAITEPMKGTWPRGQNFWQDILNKRFLANDPKNQAENLMITDLLRNDLGRLGQNIKVPKLFKVTGYNTLFQMTSIVTAELPRDISIKKIFQALFPSGSVTGAPKIRAMQIIKEIETEERNIYTGAIGYIAPNKDLYFNIPIRTLLFQGNKGELGIGGGIVWDSTSEGEWAEGLLKAQFLKNLAC